MAERDTGKARILIVEDNISLAANLSEFLSHDSYILDFAADGLMGLHLMATNVYDVIVLDVMLPGIDGFELCRRVREDLKSTVPIILLTAKDSIEDKSTGFARGADDYLTKPFDLRELEMRIKALSRRRLRNSDDVITAEDVQYQPGTLSVSLRDGTNLTLTGTAATLFEMLIRAYPSYVPYETLSERVWGEDGDAHLLRTHVYALRKNLRTTFARDMIETFHGRGYRLLPGTAKS